MCFNKCLIFCPVGVHVPHLLLFWIRLRVGADVQRRVGPGEPPPGRGLQAPASGELRHFPEPHQEAAAEPAQTRHRYGQGLGKNHTQHTPSNTNIVSFFPHNAAGIQLVFGHFQVTCVGFLCLSFTLLYVIYVGDELFGDATLFKLDFVKYYM